MSTVTLKKWGNSVGIRIPLSALKEANLVVGEELELVVKEGGLKLMPIHNKQEGWTEMFNVIADAQQSGTLIDLPNEFDEEDWTW